MNDDRDAIEKTLELGWELIEAQPTHPKVAELAARVIAAQPERSSAMLLLGLHHEACERYDDAKRLYLQVAGRRDNQFSSAASALRHVSFAMRDFDEALRWARVVLEEDQENWDDWMELASALAETGQVEEAWPAMDDAVVMCARNEPDRLPTALAKRAGYLLASFAPIERFIPAAEEAMRANVASPEVGLMLGWSYLVQYRFEDTEQLALRLLRENPTEELFLSLLQTARTVQNIVDNAAEEGITLDDVRRSGMLETSWQHLREQSIGVDLASALAALDEVMPAEVRATLAPPADPEKAEEAGAIAGETLLIWHDGQPQGSGAVWGLAEPFRLLSLDEVIALQDAIEADQAAYPEWPENDVQEPVMTDDAGAYLVVAAFGAVVRRQAGHPDVPVASTMAGWVWERVEQYGGVDPRPAILKDPSPKTA